MNYNIKEIQKKLTDLLQTFHDFCSKYNLVYYMSHGTMLGSYRHKGFIPWDDDVDVMMPREDYNKLISLSRDSRLPQNIFLKYNETSKDIIFSYAMFVDKTTTLVYEKPGNAPDMVEGIYIDIFPVDGTINNLKRAKLRSYEWFYLNKKLIYSQEVTQRKNVAYRLFNKYAHLFDPQKIYKKLEKKSSKISMNDSDLLLISPTSGGPMRKDILGKPTLYPFEGRQFYGPEKAEDYLEHIFGDFMQLPPVEERVSHHNYKYINLHLPFEKYLSGLSEINEGEKNNGPTIK